MGFWYWLGHSLSRLVAKTRLSYRVEEGEKLKSLEGGLIIAGNHVSFLDPPLVGAAFREPIYYFARKTLFDHPITKFLLPRLNALPVNQSRPELSVLKRIIGLLRDGEKVLIFPEGERSWDGELKMEGQSGVGMIVAKAGVPVLPVRLFGPEKALPRGSRKIKRHPVTLVVGEPIDFSGVLGDDALGTKEKYSIVADRIMKEIAALEMSESRGE